MIQFIVRRLLVNILIFLLITVGVFALVHAAPGDPVQMMISPDQINAGSTAFIEHERHVLGLDKPVPIQYFYWLGDAVRGDLGYSYVTHRPVTALLLERMGPTVELMGVGLLVSLVIGIPMGIIAAVKRNSWIDYAIAVVSLSAVSIPSFFFAMVAIFVVSLKLRLLPSAGMQTPGLGTVGDRLLHLIMPTLILGFAAAGPFVRYVRSGLVGELAEDYTRTARAKGAPPFRVVVRHAFRNSLIPLITVVTLSIPGVLGGAVILEQVFAWPGMGQLAISSVTQNDYPVLIGFSLMVAALVLLCNLTADVLYAVVDPRVSMK